MSFNWSIEPLPEMTDKQFVSWQNLLEEKVGITVLDHRRSFLQLGVGTQMRDYQVNNYDDYYTMIYYTTL